MDQALRESLVRFLTGRFSSCPLLLAQVDDIVHQGWLNLRQSPSYTADKENFGYLSVLCLRLGYRIFKAESREISTPLELLVTEDEAVGELYRAEEAAAVWQSLSVLREVERIVVTQRYYADYSFARIAEENGLKLNTVLSHHRRALEKLRPRLTQMLGYGKEETDEYE